MIAATIQARMNSKRLPGKMMKKIHDKPIIEILVNRIKRCKKIDKIIISTSKNKKDDKLALFCKKKLKIEVFRGSENDVLSRISSTIKKYGIKIHIECFGDGPFIDPSLIDRFVMKFKKSNYDCLTNTLKTSYPPGQEFWTYKGDSLTKLNQLVKKSDKLREHVGYNFSRFKQFKIKSIIAPKKYYYPNFYIELDTKKDLIFLRKIYTHFINSNNLNFELLEIIHFLKNNKKLLKINDKEKRKWKILRDEKN